MSIKNLKKILLAGTALVAVSAFSVQAQAAVFAHTAAAIPSSASGTWANTTNGTQGNATSASIATAGHGDSVLVAAGQTLTVTNNATADDGSANANTFDLGAVTNTGGTGLLTVINGGNNALTTTIASANLGGAISFAGLNQATAAGTHTVTGDLTGGSTFVVSNAAQATAAMALAVTVGGNLAITGTTTVTGGGFAGASTSALTVTGNSTFTGLLTIAATTNAAATSTVNLNGATNVLTAGATIDDSTGLSFLKFNGTAAQTVSGAEIKAATAGEGVLVVNNATGVTFSNLVGSTAVIGTVRVEKTAGNSSATFQNTLGATTIKLGTDGNAGDTNTLTLDGTTQAFTVTGAITGTATEIDNVVVSGGKTITWATATGTNLDTITVSGTSTKLTTGQNVVATVNGVVVGTGATFETTGNTVTNNVSLTGTLGLAGGAVTGTIDGSAAATGTLATTVNGTVTGNIGTTKSLAAITVGTGATLSATADMKSTATTLTGTGALSFITSTAHAITTDIAAAVNGDGAITIADVNTAVQTITGNIGTSTAKLATLTVTDGANTTTTTTTGNLYVNAISLGAADTLQFLGTSAQTVSGTLAGAGAGKGILTVGNGTTASNVTFSGAVGGTTLASMTTSAGATATFSTSAAIAGAFTSSGTTYFAGASASTLTGTVTNIGTIKTTGAGLVTTGALTNTGNGVVNLSSGDLTSTAALTNATGGTITLAAGRTLQAATQVAGTGTYNFGVSTDAATGLVKSAGKVVLTGGITDLTNATINVNVPSTSGYIATGAQFKVVDGVGAATTPVASSTTAQAVAADDSRILSFTYARGDNATIALDSSDVYLIATRVGYATIGTTTGNDQAVGAALDTIAGTGGTELDAIQGQLNAAATDAAVHNVLESIVPTVDGSAQVAALSVGTQVQGINDTRMASLRSGDGTSGVAAGASANGWSLWVQGYGQHSTQDENGGVKGYSANTLGGAVGVDSTNILNNGVLGATFNYGKSNADSDNVNTTNTDVDNYGLSVYGTVDVGSNYFVNGQVGYAYNKVNMDRHDATGPGLGITANGDTNSDQYSAKVALGRDYSADHGLTLTPSISAAYTHLRTAGYTETGAGAANLVVGSDAQNVVNLGVGGTATWNLKNTDGSTMKPALRVGYTYDATADKVEVTSNFSGLPGTVFATEGARPDRSQFNIGAGVTYMTTANWDLSANYDYTYKANYDAHAGVLRATSHF